MWLVAAPPHPTPTPRGGAEAKASMDSCVARDLVLVLVFFPVVCHGACT